MNFQKVYEQYLNSKHSAWEASTLRSESFRVKGLDADLALNPEKLFDYMINKKKAKPYSVRTLFNRLSDFYQWAMDNGHIEYGRNIIRDFVKTNAKRFKNAYEKSVPDDSVRDAAMKIANIPDDDDKKKALQLLSGAMRFTESTTIRDGSVLGKGAKRRQVSVLPGLENYVYPKHYITFVRNLKKYTGYSPHDLRKIAAMQAARNGATVPELMGLLGHSSLNAVLSYIQAAQAEKINQSRHDDINEALTEVTGGNSDDKQVSRTVQKGRKESTTR